MPQKTFVEGMVGQPNSFLPIRAKSDVDKTISKLLYRGLFKYDNFGTLIPDLAETWSVSNEGLVYTITIKDNQYWSDGTKITADDLLYTAYKDENLKYVATDKIDELTVRYQLPNKFSPFLSVMTSGIMKNGSDENYKGLYTPTSGPFRIASIKKKGDLIERVILISNKNENEQIKQIVFKFYANQEDLTLAFRLGEIHAFKTDKELDSSILGLANLYKYPVQSIYYALFFNLRREKTNDLNVRQAFSKLLDVDRIVEKYGVPVEGPISKSIYTDKRYKISNYDSKFKANLQDTNLSLSVVDSPNLLEIARTIQKEIEESTNIKLSIRKYPQDEIRSEVIEKRDFDILLYGQEVGRDPDRYTYWHSTQSNPPGLNLSGFENVRADRALEEGRKDIREEERQKHYSEFQRVFSENIPAIFLHHPYMYYYVSKKVKNIGEKYTFTYADRFLDFKLWRF